MSNLHGLAGVLVFSGDRTGRGKGGENQVSSRGVFSGLQRCEYTLLLLFIKIERMTDLTFCPPSPLDTFVCSLCIGHCRFVDHFVETDEEWEWKGVFDAVGENAIPKNAYIMLVIPSSTPLAPSVTLA